MNRLLPAILGAVLFGVSLTTMNPTVSFIDSGELAAISSILGIAHPTGYPLFAILGRLVVSVPFPAEPVFALNILAAMLTSLAAVVFYYLCRVVFRSPVLLMDRGESDASITTAGLAAAATLGWSTTFWAQSVAVEVYSLHLLFLTLILLTFVKGLEETARARTVMSKYLVLCAYLTGLSFTNHMTTLLILPACIVLSVKVLGWKRETLGNLVRLFPFFLLGLSPYLFLPIRAGSSPALNWGDPSTIERFVWHVSGKQYRSWIFSGFESAGKQFAYFVSNFPSEFHWIAIGVLIVGIVALSRKSRRLLWFVLLLALGCLAYSINYDIHDIDAYFLLAYVASGILVAAGMLQVSRTLGRHVHRWVLVCMIAGIPAGQYWLNRPAVDESDNFLVHDYTATILESVDSNAVILTYQWDYFVSASYYFQHVLGVRPDVAVIDKELLRRSWYFAQLERNVPWLIERCRGRIAAFLKELDKFEHGLPYDPRVIEGRFNEMINEMISRALDDRPVYVGPEIEPQFAIGLERYPEGLLFRVDTPGKGVRGIVPEIFYRPTTFDSRLTRGIRSQYARMLTIHAIWLKRGGFDDAAGTALHRALEIDPSFEPARRVLEGG